MRYLLILGLFFWAGNSYSQIVLDFETPNTSTTFQYFGSTLEATTNQVIANPNPAGINTSANVAEFIKPAGSETWAGAFSNPVPPTGIDATAATQICIDVHMPNVGNLALKLESDAGGEWIRTEENTAVDEWEQICYDLTRGSEENGDPPAAGQVWNTLVLFFDFGQTLAEDRTYYFDNVNLVGGMLEPVEVTFQVNTSEQLISDAVYVRGTFNNFSLDNPMDDMGNGLWSTTLSLERGDYEYLFYIEGSDQFETLNTTAACVNVTDDGLGNIFVNRTLAAFQDLTLDPVCFNSCYACGESIDITFRLGFDESITPSEEGVYLAGGGNFDEPGGRFRMNDDDGDGIYEITITRNQNFSSYYTFANGACPDFSCKENIEGQDCADPGNFNDRYFEAGNGDIVLETCFMECTESTDCSAMTLASVTFNVDMSEETVSADGVKILGSMTGWQDADMTDDDGDGVYSATFDLVTGEYEYLYRNGTDIIESFEDGDPCTKTTFDGPNVFINRVLEITSGGVLDLDPVCFNSCEMCDPSSIDETLVIDGLNIYPTVSSDKVFVEANEDLNITEIALYNLQGVKMSSEMNRLKSKLIEVNVQDLAEGIYILALRQNDKIVSRKIIVQ